MPNIQPDTEPTDSSSAPPPAVLRASTSNKRALIIAGFGIALIALTAWVYSHSLWASESTIRASLLRQTPLGSAKIDVRAVVDQHGWVDPNFNDGLGSLRFTPAGQKLITTSIGGRLGRYSFPNATVVFATWEFDPSNRLVEVQVTKGSDEP